MDRRIYSIKIEAINTGNGLVRISTDCENSMWNNVMQKEWNFLEQILDTFTMDSGNQTDEIVKIAKEYEGYGQGNL